MTLDAVFHAKPRKTPHSHRVVGKRAKIELDEYEHGLEEWRERRSYVFARLREGGFIPHELIDLIENLRGNTRVQLQVYRQADPDCLRVAVKIVGKPKRGKARRQVQPVGATSRTPDKRKQGKTASEAVAFLLRLTLRGIKYAEEARQAAPSRKLGLFPRSLIAEVAMDLLDSDQEFDNPPGIDLCMLIRELLDSDRDLQGQPNNTKKQNCAAQIVALVPSMGTRELARRLKVNASTISRWRKSPEFNKMVKENRLLPEAFRINRHGPKPRDDKHND